MSRGGVKLEKNGGQKVCQIYRANNSNILAARLPFFCLPEQAIFHNPKGAQINSKVQQLSRKRWLLPHESPKPYGSGVIF